MSAEAQPISAAAFAAALTDLPVENLYAKASELNNSIAHLERSNAQLREYSDSIKNDAGLAESVWRGGDRDCEDAVRENDVVVARQRERIQMLEAEVERRGGRWHGADGQRDERANGHAVEEEEGEVQVASARVPGGRLTDEELRRRMGDDDEDGGDGIHL